MVPVFRGDARCGMRRVLEGVVVLRPFPLLDPPDLLADRDHRLDEAIELCQRFAFGGLHHQRAGDREAQGGRVKAKVDQPLGHVFGRHAAGFLQRTQVEDAFMGHASVVACIERRVVAAEPGTDVVRGEDGGLRGTPKPVRPHHAAIHPADGQDGGVSQRCRRHSPDITRRQARRRMAGQKGDKVFDHADRADTGTAAAVRNAEGFVEVQVADVAAEFPGGRDSHQGVHVGAVDVDPASMMMNDFAEFPDLRLEDAMGAGIGDHHGRQPVAVVLALGTQFDEVDVAAGVTTRHHDLHPGHLGAGGIRSVG